MNVKTKAALLDFINQIEILAQGVVHMTGASDAAKLIQSAEELKEAINGDETII